MKLDTPRHEDEDNDDENEQMTGDCFA